MASYRQLAKKNFSQPDEVEFTPFTFAAEGPKDSENLGKPGCGGCHPGGGMMELDRDGLRYDKRLIKSPALAESLDGDYYKSKWDKTGVVEVDCFICHLPGYDYKNRVKQLKFLNFKWATVAGSGIGQVMGFVKDGVVPRVEYNKRFFNEDGRVSLPMPRKPSYENCMLCHRSIDTAKRGTTWADPENPDVHHLAGLTCINCHPGGLDHQIAKGDENANHVRDDLDNTMRTCEDCHTQGYMGATVMKHLTIRTDHLEWIACQTCHIPNLHRARIESMVVVSGPAIKFTETLAAEIGARVDAKPAYERLEHRTREKDRGKIYPVNRAIPTYYTNLDADGIHYPLFISEVTKALDSIRHELKVNEKSKIIEIYSEKDMKLMLLSLSETLKGDKRFKQVKPFYHKGWSVHYLDENRNLKSKKDETWVGASHSYSISHNVAPVTQALGYGGCVDCHARNSQIFYGNVLTDVFGQDGRPVYASSGAILGYSPLTMKMQNLFGVSLTVMPLIGTMVLVLIFCLALHYTMVGAGSLKFLDDPDAIREFSQAERTTHILRMATLMFLVFTGHLLYFSKSGLLGVFSSFYRQTHHFIGIAGVFVLVVAAAYFYMWIRGPRFGLYEQKWQTKFVDFLMTKRAEDIPARRRLISPGRHKGWFWLIVITGLITGSTGLTLVVKKMVPLGLVFFLSSLHAFSAIIFGTVMFIHAYYVMVSPWGWRLWRSSVGGRKKRGEAKE